MVPSANQYSANQSRVIARPPASPSWTVPSRSPTPLASVLAHKRLAMALMAVITLVGFTTAMNLGRSYIAEATIRVSPVFPVSLDVGESRFSSSGDYRDFVQEQVFEIRNFATATAALDLLGPKRWLWQLPKEGDRLGAERLVGRLKVEPIPDSYLIRIELSGGKPDGLADIVNAVAQSYLSRTAKRELNGADVGFQLLTARQTEIEQNIVNDEHQLAGLTQELGMPSVEGALVNPYDKMLADSNAALAKARRSVLLAQAHLDAVKSHRKRIGDAEVEAKAEQQVAADRSETTTAKQELFQQREQDLVLLSGLGPNHPGRKALEAQIATTDRELAKLDQAALDRARSMLSDSEEATTSVEVSEAESNLEQMQSAEKGIEKEVESVKATAASFGTKYGRAVTVHDKLERENKDLQDVLERISLLRLKSQAPGVIALESAAMVPDVPQKSSRRMTFALFVLGALMMGVAVPTLIDLTDQKIKTADEFEAILGFPPLGVAMGSNGNSGREALRRIAFGIMREWRTSGIRSFLLTSVREGSTAALSLALADELTDLGVRALAIEASLTGSTPRQLRPPLTGSGGSTSARVTKRLLPRVAKTGVFDAVEQSISESNGDANLQRAQNGVAHTFGYLREVVDRALGNHEIVLLAGPPLLDSADSILLVQMPAGAVLVARAGRDNVSEIAAAVRELERSVPPVVGAIICGDAHHKSDSEDPLGIPFDTGDSSEPGHHYRWIGKGL
jgi:polysaccharide biosynthesis transport protein